MTIWNWSPTQYLHFGSQRLRPAIDLLRSIPADKPQVVYDLGCGPGSATVHLKARWPNAKVVGIDGSPDMLERAQQEHSEIKWQAADLTTWIPSETPDVLYSNAALHWLDNHASLFPRLINMLPQGGMLAVQMPQNFGEKTHTTIFETIRPHDWKDRLLTLLRETPTQPPSFYFNLVKPMVQNLDIWETQYYFVMEGENPIVEFTKGSFLRPILNILNAKEAEAFLREYAERVGPHYPRRSDGTTIMPFRRLFMVATK